MSDCIFCKIIEGDLPATKIYENDDALAFLDIMPIQKGHTLVIPKKHSQDFLSTGDEMHKGLVAVVKKVADSVVRATKADGCTISTNNGAASGQTAFHMHWHIIPRFDSDGLSLWPHGSYAPGEQEQMGDKIRKEIVE